MRNSPGQEELTDSIFYLKTALLSTAIITQWLLEHIFRHSCQPHHSAELTKLGQYLTISYWYIIYTADHSGTILRRTSHKRREAELAHFAIFGAPIRRATMLDLSTINSFLSIFTLAFDI